MVGGAGLGPNAVSVATVGGSEHRLAAAPPDRPCPCTPTTTSPGLALFMNLFVTAFVLLDRVWLEQGASYMEFPAVME